MSDFPTRHPYSLGIWQNQIERMVAAWIAELPVRVEHGCEVTGFAQDDTGVDVRLSDGASLRARYLVGCDGGRSLIRKAAGIEFAGWDPTRSNIIAEVELIEEPRQGIRHDATGVHGLHTLPVHRPVSRALQAGVALRAVDPVVVCICGPVPFRRAVRDRSRVRR